ncbi:TFIIB-type zinc ribbon-containing protein [Brachybacterium sp. YJGR34]|uniref:TFIIB-type zinc ribbon-containing protein n=1 Tax=Brachybacterium sp. YJGR34 TaxID=2059911 RepID=UPI001E359055|nr:TFIIB-type zinc ribbon-containing protein [Brachybacterium sp. YJGR34]
MSEPPQRPPWARPDQPARPPQGQGGPVPPAPSGPVPPPPPGDGRFPAGASGGATGAGQQMPHWPGQQPPSAPAGGQPLLGDEAMAGAADAARRGFADRIIDTSSGRDDGLNKCPRCGSTDIHYSLTAKALFCGYCRNTWNEENAEQAFGLDSSIAELRGHTMASGTSDVREDLTVVTLKCQGCGAEVVINVEQQTHARCHWCRQTLSINSQIPNGAVPDAVLPFQLTREEAVQRIDAFAGKRKGFAHGRFKREFVPDNVMGVYIPYMVVDGNMHAVLRGTGEVTTRQYTVRVGSGDNARNEPRYDADVYSVQRAFDLLVDDLTVESAARYSAQDNSAATNNILHAVQPYDVENAVAYNSHYLKGFTSERRDLNVRDVDDQVEDKFLAIARAKAGPTVSRYDRGVRWTEEGVAVHGTRWVTVYVPVWLYSYADSASGGGLVHYIAVNARNGNTMGSVPVSHPKIFAVACAAGTVAAAVAAVVGFGWFLMG